jgi:hypothetical protein
MYSAVESIKALPLSSQWGVPGIIPWHLGRFVKKLGMGKVPRVFIYLFIVFAVMAISLRVISRVSPAVRIYIDGIIGRYPVFFGSLLMAVLLSAAWISFIHYSESKTQSNRVRLVVWLTASAVFLMYALYRLCMNCL